MDPLLLDRWRFILSDDSSKNAASLKYHACVSRDLSGGEAYEAELLRMSPTLHPFSLCELDQNAKHMDQQLDTTVLRCFLYLCKPWTWSLKHTAQIARDGDWTPCCLRNQDFALVCARARRPQNLARRRCSIMACAKPKVSALVFITLHRGSVADRLEHGNRQSQAEAARGGMLPAHVALL